MQNAQGCPAVCVGGNWWRCIVINISPPGWPTGCVADRLSSGATKGDAWDGKSGRETMMTNADKVKFGNRLAKLVADNGWTDVEFAREASTHFRSGVDFRPCDIGLYMRGIQIPNPPRLNAICEALGVEERALGL